MEETRGPEAAFPNIGGDQDVGNRNGGLKINLLKNEKITWKSWSSIPNVAKIISTYANVSLSRVEDHRNQNLDQTLNQVVPIVPLLASQMIKIHCKQAINYYYPPYLDY